MQVPYLHLSGMVFGLRLSRRIRHYTNTDHNGIMRES